MAEASGELQEVLVVPAPPLGTAESLRGDLERGVAVQAVSVPTLLRHLSLSDSTLPLSSPGT